MQIGQIFKSFETNSWGAKTRSRLAMTGAVCFFLGVAGYCYTDGFDFSSPMPAVKDVPTTKAQQTAQMQKISSKQTVAVQKTASLPAQTDTNTPPVQVQADMGSLRRYSAKQAALEEVKLDVLIAEQQAKLQELREPRPVTIMAAPAPALPELPVPRMEAMPNLPSLPPLPEQTMPRTLNRSGLLAIQGMDGSLCAIVASAQGRKSLRVGDSYMGSRVQRITLDSLTLASGKQINFED